MGKRPSVPIQAHWHGFGEQVWLQAWVVLDKAADGHHVPKVSAFLSGAADSGGEQLGVMGEQGTKPFMRQQKRHNLRAAFRLDIAPSELWCSLWLPK